VVSADISSDDHVVEVGPGLGTLTDQLIAKGAKVTAVEYDERLVNDLKHKYLHTSVTVVNADIRRFNFADITAPYKVVANIPYYLTSNLIRILSELHTPPEKVVLLIQKEVAERICAKPGDMSILSVVSQLVFSCRLGIIIEPKHFTPPPKVNSQVVIMDVHPKPLFDGMDRRGFMRIVKAGFSEKRKTLRNALSGGLAISKTDAEELLRSADIDPLLRAQALDLEQWYRLYCAYAQIGKKDTP